MRILESWEDNKGQYYAIARREAGMFGRKCIEALFLMDGELWDFGGTPGFEMSLFETVEEAQGFLLTGIERQDENPEIWLEMVAL